jgi:hypothetical protein
MIRYSDRPSQIASDNLTSLETITPQISPSELVNSTLVSQTSSNIGAQTITEGISPVTTVLPIRPVDMEIIPNPDILSVQNVLNKIDTGIQTIPTENATIITEMIPVFPDSLSIGGVVNYPNAELIAARVEQSNALDNFLATA